MNKKAGRTARQHPRARSITHTRERVDRQRLETLVALRTTQLTELTRHLLTAREDERARLARDLHDELGALLTSAKLDAARLRSRLGGAAPEALERLAHLTATLDNVITLKRRIIEDLRPSTLDHLGLAVTLDILARDFTERSGVAVHCQFGEAPLSAAAELVAYRMVQEAVTNITKHARAHQVWITLGRRDGHVELTVRDDGTGFDPALRARSAHGLVGMRCRAQSEGGDLRVTAAPGQGSCLTLTLPVADPPALPDA